jgi:hypothetical protein
MDPFVGGPVGNSADLAGSLALSQPASASTLAQRKAESRESSPARRSKGEIMLVSIS